MQNTLFIGNNLPIMRGLDSATVDLIYTDPPFKSDHRHEGRAGSFDDIWSAKTADRDDLYELDDRHPELAAYIRMAGKLHSPAMLFYLAFMAVRVVEMHRLLKPSGTMYLHCDTHASHYLKTMLDAIFGPRRFRNEIVWCYAGGGIPRRDYPRKHDTIFRYVKGDDWCFHVEYRDYGAHIQSGRRATDLGGTRDVEYNPKGTPVNDWWSDKKPVINWHKESTGYPTQKPLALIERIIAASSNKGDLVFDPFAGCATTLVQAHLMGRRYIGIDINEESRHHIEERLVKNTGVQSLDSLPIAERPTVTADKPTRGDVETMTRAQARPILEREFAKGDGRCPGCDEVVPVKLMDVDHAMAKVRGGLDTRENYQLLCGNCNAKKGMRSMRHLRNVIAKEREEKARKERGEIDI